MLFVLPIAIDYVEISDWLHRNQRFNDTKWVNAWHFSVANLRFPYGISRTFWHGIPSGCAFGKNESKEQHHPIGMYPICETWISLSNAENRHTTFWAVVKIQRKRNYPQKVYYLFSSMQKTCKVRPLFCRKISTTMKILFIIGVLFYVLSECGNSLFGKGGKSGKF